MMRHLPRQPRGIAQQRADRIHIELCVGLDLFQRFLRLADFDHQMNFSGKIA